VRRMWATSIHIDPHLAGGDGFLPVFCKASATPEPCEGALPSGEDFEAFGGVGALDVFERPLSDPVQCTAQFRPGIGAISEQVAQPGASMTKRFQHRRSAVAVLNIASMYDEYEEHVGGVEDDMALAAPGRGPGQALDLLSSAITTPPASVVFTPSGCRSRLHSQLDLPPLAFPRLHSQIEPDRLPQLQTS